MKLTRPVWAQINLDNIAHNMRQVKDNIREGVIALAVIKADGYGHGAAEIASTLLENGADRFAVATLSEALSLRNRFPQVPILILGYTPDEDLKRAISNDITVTIYNLQQAMVIKSLGIGGKVHIKIDTGMGRLGLQTDGSSQKELLEICASGIEVEGIFTHFANADDEDKRYTYYQVKKFKQILETLEENGIHIPIKHVSNSAGIIDFPELNYNMVRAGIMLYGLYPSEHVDKTKIKLRQAMSLYAKISHIKEVGKGDKISYGSKFTAPVKMKIGSLPIGYADGFTRMLSMKAMVFTHGQRRKILGRICMDQCMFDADGLDLKVGDTVEIFGDNISIDEYAQILGTINYEVVCMIGKRVPRVYVSDSQVLLVKDYVLGDKFDYEDFEEQEEQDNHISASSSVGGDDSGLFSGRSQ